jgi:hypothetical protein
MLMICAATLWSIAGVFTRHLEVARGAVVLMALIFNELLTMRADASARGILRSAT